MPRDLLEQREVYEILDELAWRLVPMDVSPEDEQVAYRFIRRWLERALPAATLALNKQLDYGPGNIAMTGVYGLAVRLSDKVARLLNLSAGGRSPRVRDESLRDTFEDVLNYAVFGIMLLNDEWGDWEDARQEAAASTEASKEDGTESG